MPTQTIDMNDVTSVSFNNQTVNEIKLNGDTIWPQVRNTYIHFNDDYSSQFTLTTANSTKNWDGTIETSTDGTTWTVWDGTTGVTSSNNGQLYVRGKNNTYITGNTASRGWSFTNAHLIAISGNIESLLDNEVVGAGNHPVMANYAFTGLFKNAPIFLVPETFLPSTTLADYCYSQTFMGTNLLMAPDLPANTLVNNCYRGTFRNCTSLTTPATMFATKLAGGCCQEMYYGCTSLTELPQLSVKSIKNTSYKSMFQGCSNIKLSTTQTGDYVNAYRIPTSGTGTEGTSSLTDMFKSTGGTFTGTPTINTTYYTSNTIVS